MKDHNLQKSKRVNVFTLIADNPFPYHPDSAAAAMYQHPSPGLSSYRHPNCHLPWTCSLKGG